MKNKNIHVVTKYFYPVVAGIETNILETYSVLAEKGWNVTIHTSMDTLTGKNVIKKQSTLLRGLNIKRYPFNWYGFFPDFDWDKSDIVSLHNFNIVPHLYIMLYSFLRRAIGKKKPVLILTPHGGFNPEWSVFSKFQRWIKQKYHYTLGTFLINLVVDGVRAVSDWEEREISSKRVNRNKIEIISNGIEKEAYQDVDKLASQKIKEKVKKFGKYIIQVGRIYPIKNYETTIKALAKIEKNIKFVIVGPLDHVMSKAAYKESLLKIGEELNLSDRVIFVGVLRGIDKYYVIKHAQMMVHMAIWESFCNVVHEGLSQGLVCIVANNTALPYLIKNEENGYCMETYDANKLAEKIQFVLNNKDKRVIKDIELRNKKYGLENSWDIIAERVSDFYTKIVQQK